MEGQGKVSKLCAIQVWTLSHLFHGATKKCNLIAGSPNCKPVEGESMRRAHIFAKLWIAPLVLAPLFLPAIFGGGPGAAAQAGPGMASASPLARGGPARRGVMNVMDFGARGDGRSDDSVAIQRAFDAAKAGIVSPRARPLVEFPPLSFHITKAITVPRNVDVQALGQAELSGEGNDGLVSAEAFRANIRGINFSHFGTALKLSTGNIDTALLNVEDCEFDNSCALGIDTGSFDGSRSTVLTIRNCFSAAVRFLKVYTDVLNIENCWVCHDGGNHEVMLIDSRTTISGSMFVPYAAIDDKTALDRCWIVFNASDYCRGLRVQGCRFSGEQGGGFTVLNNYAKGNPDYLAEVGNQVCIGFYDCELDTLRSAEGRQSPIVLYAMPNAITLHNCSGTIARGLVTPAPGFVLPAAAKPGEMQRYSMEFDGASRRMTNQLPQYGSQRPVSQALMPFVRQN
jgi:hypothetical protein